MRPLRILPPLLALLLAGSLLAPPASADDPASDYNRMRAWKQYLNSPSPVKSISSYRHGEVWGYDTPLESGRFYRTPGYYHQYSSPYERETFDVPQVQGGEVIRRLPVPVYPYPPPAAVPVYPYPSPYRR